MPKCRAGSLGKRNGLSRCRLVLELCVLSCQYNGNLRGFSREERLKRAKKKSLGKESVSPREQRVTVPQRSDSTRPRGKTGSAGSVRKAEEGELGAEQ